jgi:hypothetical protein
MVRAVRSTAMTMPSTRQVLARHVAAIVGARSAMRMTRLSWGSGAEPAHEFDVGEYQDTNGFQKSQGWSMEKIFIRSADASAPPMIAVWRTTISFGSRIGATSAGSGRTIVATDCRNIT